MSTRARRAVIVCALGVAGFAVGRLVVRAVLNLLVGGTLFGGNLP